jgi:hypothetical protein
VPDNLGRYEAPNFPQIAHGDSIQLREKSATVLVRFLDKVAAKLPVEKQASVRSLQKGLSENKPLSFAIKEAYPLLEGEQRGMLAMRLVKAALASRNAPTTAGMRSSKPEIYHGPVEGGHKFMQEKRAGINDGLTDRDIINAGLGIRGDPARQAIVNAGLGASTIMPLGALAGIAAGATRGNTAEGLGRGIIRGGMTGVGAGLGGMAGDMIGQNSKVRTLMAMLGTIGGGVGGYALSGKMLGKPAGKRKEEAAA